MEYTIEQKKVFGEIMQELREAEERKGRKALRIRYWTNRYWDSIEMPVNSILLPDMIRRLQSVDIKLVIRLGRRSNKYIDLKKMKNENK